MADAKLLCYAAVSIFIVAMFGAITAKWVSQASAKWMQLSNAVAGGVLIAVSLVHMLPENSDTLRPWGQAVSEALAGADPEEGFPVGSMLFGSGFFLIVIIEHIVGPHDETAHAGHTGHKAHLHDHDEETSTLDSNSDSSDEEHIKGVEVSAVAGLGAFIGISVHSVIEGLATGSAQSSGQVLLLMFAILIHKGFAAFAVGSSLHGVGTPALWWLLVSIFSLATPLAIMAGGFLGQALNEEAGAAMQCTAAGTLLAIGITHMLMPALSDPEKWRRRKLIASVASFTAMSVLATWA